MKDPTAAEKHFKDLVKAADGPLSRAKAAYWLGRIAESKDDKAAANDYYKTATRERDTFHGMLAMQKLNPGSHKLDVTPPAFPSAEQIANFTSLDAVKAVVVARKAGLSRELTRPFYMTAAADTDER